MFNLNQVINLNVQSQSSHHMIIHPRWGVTAPAGSVRTGNYQRALLRGCSHRLTWTGCFLTGTNGCGLVLFPWGCVISVIGRLSLMVICARGFIWHDQLTAVPSVNRIPSLHFVASWTSLTMPAVHVVFPCSRICSDCPGTIGWSGFMVSVVEVLLALLHAHYGSHFFFCWVLRLKQCTRHQQLGLFQHLMLVHSANQVGPGTQTGPMLCLFWRGAWPSGQHSRLSH